MEAQQTQSLPMDGLIDGDIVTLGRWQSVRPNPKSAQDWTFQQFDVVFATDGESDTSMNAATIDELRASEGWVVFAIKRPQVTPTALQPPEVPEEPEQPAEEPTAGEEPASE